MEPRSRSVLDTAGHFIVAFVDTFRKVDTMSRMSRNNGGRRAHRRFTDEFKEGAVRLVHEEGKTVGAVARELDLTVSALGLWVRQARAERTKGRSGLMKEEREELTRLRKEVPELRLERDLLRRVSALFAKDQR
jgi:transposase